MASTNLSGCFTDKQIAYLNDKFSNELPFQLGDLLDETFFKVLSGDCTTADHKLCDHLDVPQATPDGPVIPCIIDGDCLYLAKQDFIDMFESVTTLAVDPVTCELIFNNELGTEYKIPMPSLTLDSTTNELIWTDWKGIESRFSFPSSDCLENGTHNLCVLPTGVLETTDYGQGQFLDNTAPYILGVSPSGEIVEMSIFNEKNDTKILCDTGNNNKSYLCCYRQDLNTGTVTTTITELDGTTPYTVVGSPEIPEKLNNNSAVKKETISSEKIIYDGNSISLLNKPTDATCAYLSVESTDREGIRGYWDGVSIPTNSDGHLFNDCSKFALGTADNGLIDINELDNFQFIGNTISTQGCVWVTYYKES